MTRKRKVSLAVIAIIVLVAGAWGFRFVSRQASTVKESVTLKYIINTIGTITPIDIAIEKGLFEEQGIKIETVGLASGGAPSMQAILGGTADIGGAATPARHILMLLRPVANLK
jgi:ABC-type nitrate/sulfonate/bicarbonate transport system substrate-binding protein